MQYNWISFIGYFSLRVSIPQAVSTIAILNSLYSKKELREGLVSIPQAVSTIAIWEPTQNSYYDIVSFNTASGKYYCNVVLTMVVVVVVVGSFNTASGKYYCNGRSVMTFIIVMGSSFNTASGKYYCNNRELEDLGTPFEVVSIPQAVSTIAIDFNGFKAVPQFIEVSIPQAVSTIAITFKFYVDKKDNIVSIPQAVSTIAMN